MFHGPNLTGILASVMFDQAVAKDAHDNRSPSTYRLGTFSSHREGPGQKTLYTIHKNVNSHLRDTPGARRMLAVIQRRRANWQK